MRPNNDYTDPPKNPSINLKVQYCASIGGSPTKTKNADILRYMHFGKIADTKWIYTTYRIFGFSVKSWPRKTQLWDNKKGKSIGSDSPL
jgi:hypothetical protein